MWTDDYKWHYDYTRLAWDTGFCFEKYKYLNLDKNKICLIDVDRIIKERDVSSVDRNISTVLQYVLDSEQAEVLDTNFVKIFRLSQLSVEYLLFCKKYLDKTVVLLKKEVIKLREEIKEFKLYTEELETQISTSRINSVATFKCNICTKIFSSEDYLNSHLKRRHISEENKTPTNSEAEKLHLEIKELKERLNNTEKFIQEKPSEVEINSFKSPSKSINKDEDRTTKLVSEIQDSFEKFQKHVEEKMTTLHAEKSFFTDKYDKLFEIVLQYKTKEQNEVEKVEIKKSTMEPPKIESTTQTSNYEGVKKSLTNKLEVYTMKPDNIINVIKESAENVRTEENIDEKIEKKLSNFEENIESKISLGLCNIETQIQTFWEKLSEVELNQLQIGDLSVQTPNISQNLPQNKPKIKPRTKLTKNAETSKENAGKVREELKKFLAKDIEKSEVKTVTPIMNETTSEGEKTANEEENEDEIFSEKSNFEENISKYSATNLTFVKGKADLPIIQSRKNLPSTTFPVKNKKSNLPLKIIDSKSAEKMREKIRKQLNDLVDYSLQEMGISPIWKGIPKMTFQRAIDIVNHQEILNKKSLPDYDFFKKSIEQLLRRNKEVNKFKQKGQPNVTRDSPNRKNPNQNIIKFSIRKHQLKETESKPESTISIKNRSLYDTDSETDIKPFLPKTFDQEKLQNAVIEELQSKFLIKKSEKKEEIRDKEEIKEKEQKSALKSFTAESNVKKKVIFDVEEINEFRDDAKKKVEESSSISDFEISE